MPPTKSSKTSARKQARASLIKRNNAIVAARAKALTKAGIFSGGTAKKIQAKVSSGVKGLSQEQKTLRNAVNRAYKKIDASFFDEKFKPLPKERVPQLKSVNEKQANQIRQQGYSVFKIRGKEYAVVTPHEKITKSGEVTLRAKNYRARFIKITPESLVENKNGVTPLYRDIEGYFKRHPNQRMSFYFRANQNDIRSLHMFANAEDMYDFIMSYDEALLGELDSIAIVTYKKMKDIARETGAKIQENRVRKGRKSYNKPREKLNPRQLEHARNQARIRYALRKSKTKPNK